MTLTEANSLVSKVEFLNFKLEFQVFGNSHILIVRTKAPDTRDRTKMLDVMHQTAFHLDGISEAEMFMTCIFEAIVNILRHEASELFKVDGHDIFNEHDDHATNKEKMSIIKKMYTINSDKPWRQDNMNYYKQSQTNSPI